MAKKQTPVIVSFSGGKDSTALLHHLLDTNQPIAGVMRFVGGWDYEELDFHCQQVEQKTALDIIEVYPLLDFNTYFNKIAVVANTDHPKEAIKKGDQRHLGYGWPSKRRQWCTDLKTRALDAAAKRLWPGAPQAIGFTADETTRLLGPRQIYLRERGKVTYPLIDAGITQQTALDQSLSHGYSWDGLYNHFRRISCWCCPLRSLTDWRILRTEYPHYWARLRAMQDACPAHHDTINHGSTVEDLERRFAAEQNGTPTKAKHA